MEATLRISLYNYPYLKLAKMLCLTYNWLRFLFNKIRDKEGGTGSAWKGGEEWECEGYTHVSKT
jgi:hypothetical protein